MTFREDGRVQGLLEENTALKKKNADLAAKYASAHRIQGWLIIAGAVLAGLWTTFLGRTLPDFGDKTAPRAIAREVTAQIRRNPRIVFDRQSAAYLKEKIVMSAYHEGVRDAREEFERERFAKVQAQPSAPVEGRDITRAPSVPILPLNQVIYGRIVAGDPESYLFHAHAGERVVFRMRATMGSQLSPRLWFDSNGSVEQSSEGRRHASLVFKFESAGTYVIFCDHQYHDHGNSGSYALSARHR